MLQVQKSQWEAFVEKTLAEIDKAMSAIQSIPNAFVPKAQRHYVFDGLAILDKLKAEIQEYDF